MNCVGLPDHYRAMARYNRWMNVRLYDATAQLSDADRTRDLKAFFSSLHGTLHHLLVADRAWLMRFTGDERIGGSRDRDGNPIRLKSTRHIAYEDFTDLRVQREMSDAHILEYVSALTVEQLSATFRYKTLAGLPCEHPLWWALSHFFNHQTHHRGQATTLLMQLGIDPGVTDMIAMLREE